LKGRLIFFVVLVVVWSGALGARLYDLQVNRSADFATRAASQQQRVVDIAASRGTIYDANGRELAVSVEVESVYAVPGELDGRVQTAERVAEVLPLDADKLAARLDSDREFVWVARKLEPAVSRSLRELELPGIYFMHESRRFYPMGGLAAHVLGYVGMDGDGLGGLEARYEDVVEGSSTSRLLMRDNFGQGVAMPGHLFAEPMPGRDLHLTIDASLQYLAESELHKAVRETRADGGVVVILDPEDSAVLAMASAPGFDPNHFSDYPEESWRNRAVAEVFEPGSTFKMVTAAAAFENLLISPDDNFWCEEGSIVLGRTRIRDHKPFGLLTFREVMAKSSNVGVIKAALIIGEERLHERIRAFGFGRRSGIDLPGESPGIVNPLERWRENSKAYVSFGQEISVTPLQMANAFAALANGGRVNTPYVARAIGRGGELEKIEVPPPTGEAISRHTSVTLGRVLETVVSDGTARRASLAGYRVAGKTGTAEKVIPGVGYSPTGRIASFVGIVPARSPRFVCFVMLDEPRTATHGGQVAAPIFQAIMEKALLHYGIAPDPDLWPPREPEPLLPPPVLQDGQLVTELALPAGAET
jgi:cell division protein FtsI (penicillin-binding protein 3)